jgi:hypothetical protein
VTPAATDETGMLSTRRVDRGDPAAFEAALEAARDFRGDVTVELRDGTQVEGFLYDRQAAASENDRRVRLLPKDGGPRQSICEASVAAIAFTGKDAAAGKTWENWVKRYAEKRLAGEKACIESEKLD